MTLMMTSPAFEHQGEIPKRYTCDGEDVAPALQWSGVPEGTQSLVLIVDDPDAPDPQAPKMTFVHWVVYNLPADSTGLPEGARRGDLPAGAGDGMTDFGRTGYGGPCPPIGRHRYFHKLYALDTRMPDLGEPSKAEVERQMDGHVIEQTELIGTYQR